MTDFGETLFIHENMDRVHVIRRCFSVNTLGAFSVNFKFDRDRTKSCPPWT